MKNYTRELLSRMSWLVAWLLLLLVVVAFWFHQATQESEKHSVFKPVQRIQQLKAMQAAITENKQSLPSNTSELDCDSRGRAVLTIRTMNGLNQDANTASATLQQIHQQLNFKLRCSEWVENMQSLVTYQAKLNNATSATAIEFDTALSEQVSWERQIPCMYFRSEEKTVGLMMGNPVRCARHRAQSTSNLVEVKAGFQAMQQIAKSYLSNAPVQVVQSMKGADHIFTVDPKLQAVMDKWANCLSQNPCENGPQIRTSRHVSAVILDVSTGDILAALCWSGPCDKPQMKSMSHLGALLIETPPASTAKLLHAMVLAQEKKADALMLQRQIKTSGQTDNLVTKRNEWWEKQAICEDIPKKPCSHPAQVLSMAREFQWNQNCNGASIFCGRLGLIEQSDSLILSGLIGHVRLSASPHKAMTLMSWADYDAIRQGKKRADGSLSYMNTALSIQSVIGAGDARTSALGLANLSAQISRLSQGKAVQRPALIRPWDLNIASQTAPAELKTAAAIVLGGMRKVVQPAESGWKDSGTVANTFQRVFGKPCTDECGVWAKTGTVSQQDPNFAGASLFTGVIDVAQVRAWRSNETSSQGTRQLAIGFISLPTKGIKPTHVASELAVQLIKELTEAPSTP
jgi:hypothetical protein